MTESKKPDLRIIQGGGQKASDNEFEAIMGEIKEAFETGGIESVEALRAKFPNMHILKVDANGQAEVPNLDDMDTIQFEKVLTEVIELGNEDAKDELMLMTKGCLPADVCLHLVRKLNEANELLADARSRLTLH